MHKVFVCRTSNVLRRTNILRFLSEEYIQVASISVFPTSRSRQTSLSSSPRSKNSQKTFKNKKHIDELVVPVKLNYEEDSGGKSDSATTLLGEEMTGSKLSKEMIREALSKFLNRPEIRQLCEQKGLGPKLFNQAYLSFRRYCLECDPLPAELHIIFYDLAHQQGHVDDLFPYFMNHALKVYPHLECLDDLKKISDLRLPHDWYPEARSRTREFIFHAGPTNSGKTYQALKSFMEADSGFYCGPLKMLAVEVFHKTNNAGVECDLITGEERRYMRADGSPSSHVACTVEMLNPAQLVDVAVIDEIQMLRDQTRGWAWTRALLGVNARQVHLCGEAAAIEVVKGLLMTVGEKVKVCEYKRMSPLTILDHALGSLNNVQNGDCIVAFSKNEIYRIGKKIESMGREVALIYGSLPPATKLDQAHKFNDPTHPCKVMVATDAIGMGLNLSIKRVIFWGLSKPSLNEYGEREMEFLSTSSALQIGGRAGRFGTTHECGEVTTYRDQDLPILKQIMSEKVCNIEKAGLQPTVEQIEMFSYYLPKSTLTNLLDIFVTLCSVDEGKFFMCNMDDFKLLATMIEHVPNLNLRTRYVFCLAPVNVRATFICQNFVKIVRKYSTGQSITWNWLSDSLEWTVNIRKPQQLADLVLLEMIFDVLDLYLWLGHRFPQSFVDSDLVRHKQHELDEIFKQSMMDINLLLAPKNKITPLDIKSTMDEVDLTLQEADEKITALATTLKPAAIADKLYSMVMEGKANQAELTTPLNVNVAKKTAITGGRIGFLTKKLIEKGLLTPAMVGKLQEEWLMGGVNNSPAKKPPQEPVGNGSQNDKKGIKRNKKGGN